MRELLLDTSPLITLCTFRAQGQLIIEHLLEVASLKIVRTVATEATANPTHSDAAVVDQLLKAKRITELTVPSTPLDSVIDAYTKLGQGERDTIRLALTMPRTAVVLDDYLAFVIACRFGLTPIFLLDLIVSFVEDGSLDKSLANEIVDRVEARYSPPFVSHTRYKLK